MFLRFFFEVRERYLFIILKILIFLKGPCDFLKMRTLPRMWRKGAAEPVNLF